MERHPSWEATSRTASEEIPVIVKLVQSLLRSQGPATDTYREPD
jgi:hypothetical protein